MNTFKLKIIAYDRTFYDDDAVSITFPAVDGEMQILALHEECVVAVETGGVRIVTPEEKLIPAVCGTGFLEMNSDNEVLMIVDTIERPEEIDIRRAKEAKERAEEKLIHKQSIIEYNLTTASLSRAMARLKEASKYVK